MGAVGRAAAEDNQPLEWTDPAERSLPFWSVVGAGPAIERRSVMPQQPSSMSELIRLLRHFGARPALYIQPVDVQNAQSFLGGVNFCVQVLTRPLSYEEMDAVVASRGWRVSPGPRPEPLEPQMPERGMTDAQIIAELAEIEAATLERRSDVAS